MKDSPENQNYINRLIKEMQEFNNNEYVLKNIVQSIHGSTVDGIIDKIKTMELDSDNSSPEQRHGYRQAKNDILLILEQL